MNNLDKYINEKPTIVVDIHKVNGKRPHYDVYIGRRVPFTEFTEDSIWHNPYSRKHFGDKALAMFEEYLRNNEYLLSKLPELKGKILGCWCKNRGDGRCHGDIIIKIMKERGII